MKLDSKHWLQWRGTKEGNTVVYPRAWTPAAQTTDPNYLRNRFAEIRTDQAWAEAMERRERFKEIRADQAWAEAMERQNNNPNHGTDLNALRDEWVGWVERNPPSPALIEAVEQIEFNWGE
jgi:hypothetical protein